MYGCRGLPTDIVAVFREVPNLLRRCPPDDLFVTPVIPMSCAIAPRDIGAFHPSTERGILFAPLEDRLANLSNHRRFTRIVRHCGGRLSN